MGAVRFVRTDKGGEVIAFKDVSTGELPIIQQIASHACPCNQPG